MNNHAELDLQIRIRRLEEDNAYLRATLRATLREAHEFVKSWGEIVDTKYPLYRTVITKVEEAMND